MIEHISRSCIRFNYENLTYEAFGELEFAKHDGGQPGRFLLYPKSIFELGGRVVEPAVQEIIYEYLFRESISSGMIHLEWIE